MQDFSFLLGNDFKLPQIDIYGPYKQALTLRQLADAREYQRAQTETARLKAMQERQEMAEMESFRREYKPGMAPDEVMRRWPTYGPKALTAQGQALTQQRLAETQKRLEEEAKARLDKAAAEKQEKIRQQVANIGMQAAGLENKPQGTRPDFADLSPREQFFNTQVASALIDQGIVPAEQFGAFQVPQDMAAAKRAYGAAYDPAKVQAYEAAEQTRTKSALEIQGKQWEEFNRRVRGVTGQPSWTKALQEAPPEIASQFNPEFSLPELKRAQSMSLDAAQQIQKEGAEATREATQQNQKFTQATALRNDWQQDTKLYPALFASWENMQDAAKSRTGAGDLKLAYSMVKMLDAQSVVMPGERADIAQAAGLMERVKGVIQKLQTGGVLDDKTRGEFLAEARAINERASARYGKLHKDYYDRAIRNKVDPRDVLVDYRPDLPGIQSEPAAGAPAVAGAPAAATGAPGVIPLQSVMPGYRPPAAAPVKPRRPLSSFYK